MLKKFRRQIISLMLVFALVASTFSFAVGAAETTDVFDELYLDFDGVVVEFSGSYMTDTAQAENEPAVLEQSGENVKITANSYLTKFAGAYDVYEAGVTTVHVDPTDDWLQISFECTCTGDGSFEIHYDDDTIIYPIGSRYYIGDEFDIVLTTEQAKDKSVELVLSNIEAAEEIGYTVTVQEAVGGSVKCNTEYAPYEEDLLNTESLKLSATPDNGYVFAGYQFAGSDTYFTINSDFILWPHDNAEIVPVFVPNNTPSFMVGGVISGYALYDSFSAAVQYAADNHSELIVPMADFEITENATIPSGTTLLIPDSSDHEVYTEKPNVVETKSAHSRFLKATIKSGATLTFENGAALSVGGSLSAPSGGKQAEITGAYGQLVVEDGAQATFNSGSSLYAWGFVTGGGTVECMDGVKVYESFQIEDFAGGSNSLTLATAGVFPFSQYYIQNIECTLKMNAGAEEIVFGALDAGGGVYDTSLVFIGGDGAMFNVADGYILKYYDYDNDKLVCEIHGDASLDNIKATLPIMGETDTSIFQMPINNIGVELAEGDLTIKQDLILLPDSYVVTNEGTTVDIQSDVFLISDADWEGQNRVYPDDNCKPLPFSATRYDETGNGASPRSKDGDMANASMEMNGSMNITGEGTFNMTASGADFTGTGDITNTSTVPSSTAAEVKLVNYKTEDKVQTENTDSECNRFKGEAYSYNEEFDRWTSRNEVTVTFMGKDPADASIEDTQLKKLEAVPYGTATGVTDSFTKSYYYDGTRVYLFQGWKDSVNNKVYGSDADNIRYAFDDLTTFTADYLSYRNRYAVYVYDRDGTTQLYRKTGQAYNAKVEYTTVPADYTDATGSYVFVGWTSSLDGQLYADFPEEVDPRAVIANDNTVNYTATYRKADDYTITWKNGDTVLETDFAAAGVTPTYDGATPAKASANGKSYEFLGWSTDGTTVLDTIPAVTEDTTYYAVFTGKEIFKHSLSLNGSIDVNFYVDLPAGYSVNNVTAMFKWGHKYIGPNQYDESQPYSKTVTGETATVDGKEYAKFTLPLAAKELNDDITVTIKSGRDIITQDTYRGTDYAYAQYEATNDDDLKELIRTMLIYAADAQKNFEYNTNDLATHGLADEDLAIADVDRTNLAADAWESYDSFDGITFYGSALYLESNTGYTLYYTIDDPADYAVGDVSAVTTTIKNEEKELDVSCEKISNGKGLKITMKGLAAAEITRNITLTYKGTMIDTLNTGEYIDLSLSQGSNNLMQTVTSLYNYNQAAITYFSALGGNNG